MNEYSGNLVCGKGRRFGIVVSRWNDFFTEKMLSGAVDTLVRHGAKPENIHVVRVPGAWEIPLAVQKQGFHIPHPKKEPSPREA